MEGILLMFHVDMGTGYAIDNLCSTFLQMAQMLVPDKDKIHVSFTRIDNGKRSKELADIDHVFEFNLATYEKSQHKFIAEYIKKHQIDVVFGFDIPVWKSSYKHIRRAGVKKIVSYQGAPMSGLNKGIKLILKKLEIMFIPDSPDHYIFESVAIAKTAYSGRGIPENKVSVIHLGVDVEKFKPVDKNTFYAHKLFSIPEDRKIIYYSGHMANRKGIDVLVNAAKHLYKYHNRRDFHFLLLGNKDGEEQRYVEMLDDSGACDHVTFGGYKNDIEKIIPSCYLGAIASTGWDSFTMSSVEIAACGLPLLVSNLQGLAETIDEGITGYSFQIGNYKELSGLIISMLDDRSARNLLGENARKRILSGFTIQIQLESLVSLMKQVTKA